MIDNYFLEFDKNVALFDCIDKQTIEKQKIDDDFGIIKGLLFFENYKLDFIEVVRFVANKRIKQKYKYHFMDNNNNLIFRYDNAKHHLELETFPYHKHIENKILPSQEPNILIVLNEIKNLID